MGGAAPSISGSDPLRPLAFAAAARAPPLNCNRPYGKEGPCTRVVGSGRREATDCSGAPGRKNSPNPATSALRPPPTTGSDPGWGQSPGGVSPRVGSVAVSKQHGSVLAHLAGAFRTQLGSDPGWGQSPCQNGHRACLAHVAAAIGASGSRIGGAPGVRPRVGSVAVTKVVQSGVRPRVGSVAVSRRCQRGRGTLVLPAQDPRCDADSLGRGGRSRL